MEDEDIIEYNTIIKRSMDFDYKAITDFSNALNKTLKQLPRLSKSTTLFIPFKKYRIVDYTAVKEFLVKLHKFPKTIKINLEYGLDPSRLTNEYGYIINLNDCY